MAKRKTIEKRKTYSHYAPQTHIKTLLSNTETNYRNAAAFYRHREAYFVSYINQQIKENEEKAKSDLDKFNELMVKSISQVWDKQNLTGAVMQLKKGNYFDFSPGAIKKLKIQKTLLGKQAWSDQTIKILNEIAKSPIFSKNGNKQFSVETFWMNLGTYYEQELLKPVFEDIINQNINGVSKLLPYILNTGNYTSKSPMGGNQPIKLRADWTLGSSDLVKSNGYLVDADTQIPVELGLTLDNSGIEELLKENRLIPYEKLNQFGFSVKAWANTSGTKKFSESGALKSHISNLLRNGRAEGAGKINPKEMSKGFKDKSLLHSWQPYYASVYTNYLISKQLISIISPITVGLITSKDFIWISNLIESHLFYMKVKIKEPFKYKRRNGATKVTGPFVSNALMGTSDEEGYPSIEDNYINIRELRNAKVSDMWLVNKRKDKETGDYIVTAKVAHITKRNLLDSLR